MWRKFLNDEFDPLVNYPPEGITVYITDGIDIDEAYYLLSGEYRWIKWDYELDKEVELKFKPTHWIYFEDYKKLKRDNLLSELLK